ncbi:hypothetical protein Tco_1391160 [Tanacetum coccineum]
MLSGSGSDEEMICQNNKLKGVVAESFDWDEESLSSEDEGTTTVKAFMAIVEDEPVVGKIDARLTILKTRDTKIAALRLKFNAFKALEAEKVKETYTKLKILLNELENKDVKIAQAEVNAMFINNLPKKWLSMNQTQRANNSHKG